MPPHKRVTLEDVARAAGISITTASRVLNQRNGDIKISEETQKEVLEIANQLGYQPNPFASALRTKRTGVIGVIVRDICDPFLAMLAREIQKVARIQDMDILIAHAEYNLEIVGHHLAFMHSHWFDGLLLLGDIPGDKKIFLELEKTNTPFVAVARGEQTNPPVVNVDETAGMYLALDYLTELGHSRIAFLGNMEYGGVQERLMLFNRYFEEKHQDEGKPNVVVCGNSREAVLACTQSLLTQPEPPTAIFCATDLAAISAISGAQRLGWRIPEDVSIIGFDDIEGSADTYPALTTVRQPIGEMAEKAFQMLMDFINGISIGEDTRVLVKPGLMIRQSCARPRSSFSKL